ncbi:hypothetical protein ZEAMMB73_Zm00001d053662, partial [Zea mays]
TAPARHAPYSTRHIDGVHQQCGDEGSRGRSAGVRRGVACRARGGGGCGRRAVGARWLAGHRAAGRQGRRQVGQHPDGAQGVEARVRGDGAAEDRHPQGQLPDGRAGPGGPLQVLHHHPPRRQPARHRRPQRVQEELDRDPERRQPVHQRPRHHRRAGSPGVEQERVPAFLQLQNPPQQPGAGLRDERPDPRHHAAEQQVLPHEHLREQERGDRQGDDQGPRQQPQHGRHPHRRLEQRDHQRHHHRRRRRLRLHRPREQDHPREGRQVRPGPRHQRRQPGAVQGREGRGGREGDGVHARRHHQRPAHQVVRGLQVVAQGHQVPVPGRHHGQRLLPHHHRPEVLPQQHLRQVRRLQGGRQRRRLQEHPRHLQHAGGHHAQLRQQPALPGRAAHQRRHQVQQVRQQDHVRLQERHRQVHWHGEGARLRLNLLAS